MAADNAMGGGIINGARQSSAPDSGFQDPDNRIFDDQAVGNPVSVTPQTLQDQANAAASLAALQSGLEVQKNAAIQANGQRLKWDMPDQQGGMGGQVPPLEDGAAYAPAIFTAGAPASLPAVAVANYSDQLAGTGDPDGSNAYIQLVSNTGGAAAGAKQAPPPASGSNPLAPWMTSSDNDFLQRLREPIIPAAQLTYEQRLAGYNAMRQDPNADGNALLLIRKGLMDEEAQRGEKGFWGSLSPAEQKAANDQIEEAKMQEVRMRAAENPGYGGYANLTKMINPKATADQLDQAGQFGRSVFDLVSSGAMPQSSRRSLNGNPSPAPNGSSPYRPVTNSPGPYLSPDSLARAGQARADLYQAWKADNGPNYGSVENQVDAYKRLVGGESPWPDGFAPVDNTLPVGSKFRMALAPGQPVTSPGGFGTMDAIPNAGYVRKDLAVKSAWKPDLNGVAEYEVTQPLPVQQGPVGPQIDLQTNSYLPGGGTQFKLNTPKGQSRMDYLNVSGFTPFQPGK